MSIFGSILSILDWGKSKIPLQDRIERWKNEIDNLTKEKSKLLMGACDEKKAIRLEFIDTRIAYLLQLCKNKISD